jgi:argininosuccinate lyase
VAITLSVHNTPFGDIVDTEDDLQPLVAATFRDAVRAATLVDASMRSAVFAVERLNMRAGEGGITLTELADTLVRDHRLPFAAAHAVAARMLAASPAPGSPAATLAAVTRELLGAPLRYADEDLARIMSPRYFVDVRKTAGGPAPAETRRALADAEAAAQRDRAWLSLAAGALAAADDRLRERSAAL